MPFPALPDAHGIAVLVLVIVALILFTRESIPLETSSLAVLAVLAIGFEAFPYTRDSEPLILLINSVWRIRLETSYPLSRTMHS